MSRPGTFGAGVLVLLLFWVWPWPSLTTLPFTAHMTAHMAVVAVAAPLLALGIAGGRWDPVHRAPAIFSAIPASMVELVLVWAWHMPALHHHARAHDSVHVVEQATFLGAGLFLWLSALGGAPDVRRARAVSGVTGLLLTSMHMTLLGALIALTPRVLYGGHGSHGSGWSPLDDQHLGGAVMLLLGGLAYLAGGLGLVADALRDRVAEDRA